MGALIVTFYVLEVLVSILLVGIVLIQQSKSQGGLGALAGGATESVFGAATGNVITRTTVILATIFLVNTLLLAILTGKSNKAASNRAAELAAGAKTEEVQTEEPAKAVTEAVPTAGEASTDKAKKVETAVETATETAEKVKKEAE